MKARIAVLLAVVTGTSAFAATALAAPAASSAASAGNCVVVASSNKNFSTLVSLVKQAGLVKTLSGKGPFTIMAPTNAAFAKLKTTAPDTYTAVTTDKALLTKVLTYHVIPGEGARNGRDRGREEERLGEDGSGREDQALAEGSLALPQRERQGHRTERQRARTASSTASTTCSSRRASPNSRT